MKRIEILAAVLACKASKKDRSVTVAMTHDDVGPGSRGQYTAIQMIENSKTEGYGQRAL